MSQASKPESTSRRRVLQVLGAGTSMALAGCSEGDKGTDGKDSNTGDHGERVPTVVIEYWPDMAETTQFMESTMSPIREGIQQLGVDVEVKPVQFTTQVNNVVSDTRTHHLAYWVHFNAPDRLDPQEMVRRMGIDYAGANGLPNPPNWANCKYSNYAVQQAQAPSKDKREEVVKTSQEILSDNKVAIPLVSNLEISAINTNQVSAGGIGKGGFSPVNPPAYIKTETSDGSSLVTNTDPIYLETRTFARINHSSALTWWNTITHSGLVEYDENFELQKVLAKDYNVDENGKRVTVELRDATFHNGDPITAEDVKFTFEHLAKNPAAYPQAGQPPYESIETVDEKTAVFTFEEPYLPLVTREWARWGIFHKDTWIESGAKDSPKAFDLDPIVGSGPFQVTALEPGQYMEMEPFDDHPEYSPANGLIVQAYRDQQSMMEAFENGELDVANKIVPGSADRIREDMDNGEIVTGEGFLPWILYPQVSWSPMKFMAFRDAIGKAIDRQLVNELGYRGDGKPMTHSVPWQSNHPFFPAEDETYFYTDDPTGDVDAARNTLSEAGWTWDDDDNLRFPSGADLSPVWPKGEIPSPDNFECINENGEFEQTKDVIG